MLNSYQWLNNLEPPPLNFYEQNIGIRCNADSTLGPSNCVKGMVICDQGSEQ